MKKLTLFSVVAVLVAITSVAQEKKWYTIHEDLVIPSQDAKYMEAIKSLKAACVLHKTNVTWVTVKHDDFSYIHLSQIKNFAELDKNIFADLIAKMGQDAFGKMMSSFDGCYDTHSDFVVEEMPSLSYLTPPQGENYRDVLFWSVAPGKEMAAEGILMEWKKLYEGKKVPEGFVSYKVVYGRAPGFAVVFWGKDPVDSATKGKKTWDIIGKEADDLIKRTYAITTKWSTKRANIQPDLSMMPTAAPAASK